MAYDLSHFAKLGHLKSLGLAVKNVTDGLDSRIDALEAVGAQANVLEGVKVNGTALAIANKMVDILVATGTADGSIKVNGTDVSVAGLAALAYKAEVSAEDLSTALAAAIDAKAENSDLTTLSGKVTTLIGNVSGDDAKSVRVISAEEVAKIVAGADASYDTLKEIADWILSDTTGAAKMASDISALKTKLTLGTYDNSGTATEYATVKAYVEAVTANFISLTALSTTDSGSGNVVTGVGYNSSTGVFTITKGTMVAPVASATAGNLTKLTADGQIEDTGIPAASVITQHQDITGKADKVTGGVSGNFAAIDENGNLADSGHKHSDYLTQHQDISGKADKDTDAVTGNIAKFDPNGNPIDAGIPATSVLTQHQDITGKADKAVPTAAGEVATLDASGNLVASGTLLSSLLVGAAATDAEVTEMLAEVFGS